MKLFIWEGDGISDAYHDDGTLVVLAETAEQAREVVRENKRSLNERQEWFQVEHGRLYQIKDIEGMKKITAEYYYAIAELARWDGRDEALDREPDRIVELNTPTVVAFNGGGYD